MRIATLFSLALVLCLSVFAADKPDFNGAWKLDAAKSDFGLAPPENALTYKIEQNEPKILITEERESGKFVTKLTIDAEEENNPPGFQFKSKATWKDGKLVVETKGNSDQYGAVNILDEWTLSDDKKTLTIARDAKTDAGGTEMKMIFTKQAD